MKWLIAVIMVTCAIGTAEAGQRRYSDSDVQVDGYYRRDGTYVEPHYRSAPNANKWDNYGYEGGPKYNEPRSNPSPSWNTPNPGRLNDNNPNNDNPWGIK